MFSESVPGTLFKCLSLELAAVFLWSMGKNTKKIIKHIEIFRLNGQSVITSRAPVVKASHQLSWAAGTSAPAERLLQESPDPGMAEEAGWYCTRCLLPVPHVPYGCLSRMVGVTLCLWMLMVWMLMLPQSTRGYRCLCFGLHWWSLPFSPVVKFQVRRARIREQLTAVILMSSL